MYQQNVTQRQKTPPKLTLGSLFALLLGLAEQLVLFTNLSRGWRASTTVSQTYWADWRFRHVRQTTSRQGPTQTGFTPRPGQGPASVWPNLVAWDCELQQSHQNKETTVLPTVHTCCCLQRHSQLSRTDQSDYGEAFMLRSRVTWKVYCFEKLQWL